MRHSPGYHRRLRAWASLSVDRVLALFYQAGLITRFPPVLAMEMMEPQAFSGDEAAIRAVIARLSEAWNQADAGAFASVFTEDVDYVTFMGTHLKGLPSTVQVHGELWNSALMKGSRLEGEVKAIRFLNDTTAIVHGVGAIKLRWQKKAPANRLSINTNVLVKHNGQWLITAFHNCRIRPLPWFVRLFASLGSKKA